MDADNFFPPAKIAKNIATTFLLSQNSNLIGWSIVKDFIVGFRHFTWLRSVEYTAIVI